MLQLSKYLLPSVKRIKDFLNAEELEEFSGGVDRKVRKNIARIDNVRMVRMVRKTLLELPMLEWLEWLEWLER